MTQQAKRDPVRTLSNRIFMTISGRWFRSYSIVNHVGRTSGRRFRNPVSAFPLGDGYVIAVLYGLQSQWVRNVMATGRLTLRTKGRDHVLERPQIIGPDQALPALPPAATPCRGASSTSFGPTAPNRPSSREHAAYDLPGPGPGNQANC